MTTTNDYEKEARKCLSKSPMPNWMVIESQEKIRLALLLAHKNGMMEAAKIASKYPRQFGCDGKHHGVGTLDCPKEPHHHHDNWCKHPCDGIAKAIKTAAEERK